MKGSSSAKLARLLLSLSLVISMIPLGGVYGASTIQWGAVQTGSYDSPSIYTLNWSGDVLDKGGLNLSTLQMTNSSAEADIVIDYKGSIGAASIALAAGEGLESASSLSGKSFSNTQRLSKGGVYLIELHDGSYAKLRIDRYNEDFLGSVTKVFFSFVMEGTDGSQSGQPGPAPSPSPGPEKPAATPAQQPKPTPTQTPSPTSPVRPEPTPSVPTSGLGDSKRDMANAEHVYEFEEGPIPVPWKGSTAGNRFDVYRSDNGGAYVKMNDFALSKAEFTDHYAFADHTYVYRTASYGSDGKASFSPPVKVLVKKKADRRTIELTLDSLQAKIDGQEFTLDTAPTLVNSRTMVPLRFIGEALGAKVEWNGEERSVTMKLDDQTIVLKIDNSEAAVNGQKVMMDVPAQIIKDSTMVPVRFVSENLKQEIEFDSNTGKITITGQASSSTAGKGDQPAADKPKEQPKEEPKEQPKEQPKEEPKDDKEENPAAGIEAPYDFFIGKWRLWVPGVAGEKGGEGNAVTGKWGGLLHVNADYTWQYNLGENIHRGTWSKVEKTGQILLANFQYQADWYVTNKGGDIQVTTFGMYFSGARE
jgi:hypothetical protein